MTDESKSKRRRYAALVRQRKAYDPRSFGLTNPAVIEDGRFDSEEIGPWTLWAGDLDADVMVVGQDWGDDRCFRAQQGLDSPRNETNRALAKLLAGIGRPLPPLPTPDDHPQNTVGAKSRVFLTNALLWLKTGGVSAKVKDEWFGESAAPLLRKQIEIVQPRVVVGLGSQAYNAILRAFGLPLPKGSFQEVVDAQEGTLLPDTTAGALLFGVYHCSKRVQTSYRKLDEQHKDWQRIARALG